MWNVKPVWGDFSLPASSPASIETTLVTHQYPLGDDPLHTSLGGVQEGRRPAQHHTHMPLHQPHNETPKMAPSQDQTQDQTQDQGLSYHALSSLPQRFFSAVDRKDLDALIALFAPDATLTVQTDHVTLRGAAAIRDMFARFMDSSVSMSHEVTGVVVDAKSRRVATEQRYSGTLADGTTNDMCNCNFFDVGPDGRFTRVVIWMGGGSPLK